METRGGVATPGILPQMLITASFFCFFTLRLMSFCSHKGKNPQPVGPESDLSPFELFHYVTPGAYVLYFW